MIWTVTGMIYNSLRNGLSDISSPVEDLKLLFSVVSWAAYKWDGSRFWKCVWFIIYGEKKILREFVRRIRFLNNDLGNSLGIIDHTQNQFPYTLGPRSVFLDATLVYFNINIIKLMHKDYCNHKLYTMTADPLMAK